ncbi:primosomal replication protein PriC [Dickeya solani]|uniref:Primosomal replication protein n=2 Tax=Dickeya solani TaxID=1089444 RepID=A0AAP3D5F3_9GAMM|nr:primosomal replication protein [Dickeya solani]ANE76465.1 prephenate dehydrogenase [Dickeya solani IPO 2222]AUC44090.1 Primosomal replication protein N prime prime [Dickeya solani RNS 08.23.3.1.A]AUH08123.1 prephenate dehydrogenase [Dickeya solani D s0432-1]AUH12138.1 prephenate dehydrogenase [Dickeya solani]AYQ46959.1 Primosomal replication protein N'' [Dickeya solani]
METQALLAVLARQIDTLARDVEPIAARQAPRSRFDRQLFSCYGTRLGDYLDEIRHNYQHLQQYVQEQRLDRVAFMAEKLLTQMTALQRELATQPLRAQEPATPAPQDRYQKLAEYQGYERRLLAMIQDRESLLATQSQLSEQQRLQRELAALEGRLARCRQALSRLERQIERQEQGF